MSRFVIALTGHATAGKSTLRKALINELEEARWVRFAEPVYHIAHLMGWNGVKDAKGRRLLRLIGTEAGRECIDENIWVKKWKSLIRKHGVYIADDCRFLNEAAAVRSVNGIIIRIERPGLVPDLSHKSESEMLGIKVDMTLINSGIEEEFTRYAVDQIIREFGARIP